MCVRIPVILSLTVRQSDIPTVPTDPTDPDSPDSLNQAPTDPTHYAPPMSERCRNDVGMCNTIQRGFACRRGVGAKRCRTDTVARGAIRSYGPTSLGPTYGHTCTHGLGPYVMYMPVIASDCLHVHVTTQYEIVHLVKLAEATLAAAMSVTICVRLDCVLRRACFDHMYK